MNTLLTPPRLRSTLPAVDISGFFQAVQDALNLYLKTVKWPVGTEPVFIHTFPQQRLALPDKPFDVITFSVGGSEMATTSNDGGRVPLAPQVREIVDSTSLAGYKDRSIAWKEEVAVVFTIWSKTNAFADAIVTWFHRFMMIFAFGYGFFMARGVDRFFFLKRGKDEVEEVENQELYKRTLVYRIRIEYVLPVTELKTLESVTISGKISDQQVDTIELSLTPP